MITKFKSVNFIIEKIYRDLGANNELPYNDMISWIAEALSFIGVYGQYEEIKCELKLDSNGKVKLPCGFEYLVDINYNNNPVYWATNTNATNYGCNGCKIPCCNEGITGERYNFYINNDYLISNIIQTVTNTTDNTLSIVYLGIPTDENGFPLIPDDVYYDAALTSYVISKLDYQDFRRGRIADKVYQDSEQKWLWYVNSARGSGNMPNTQQLERIKNVMKRLLPIRNDYQSGFRNFNHSENVNLGS